MLRGLPYPDVEAEPKKTTLVAAIKRMPGTMPARYASTLAVVNRFGPDQITYASTGTTSGTRFGRINNAIVAHSPAPSAAHTGASSAATIAKSHQAAAGTSLIGCRS